MDSKGNFGKAYSRDMAYAASRYTEAKLDAIAAELFRDIDKDTVDFVDNYDDTMKEPTLLPATFPTVLVNANIGIAVGMASYYLLLQLAGGVRDHHRPDEGSGARHHRHPEGARIFPAAARSSTTGRAGEDLRHRPGQRSGPRPRIPTTRPHNCIDVTEIPPTTTVEAIIDKIIELVKAGQGAGDRRHPGRNRPGRPEDHHRPQAGRRTRTS